MRFQQEEVGTLSEYCENELESSFTALVLWFTNVPGPTLHIRISEPLPVPRLLGCHSEDVMTCAGGSVTVTCHVSQANVATSWSRQLLPHLTFIVNCRFVEMYDRKWCIVFGPK